MQMGVDFVLTGAGGAAIPPPMLGDGLQGAAADCNSAEVTHAWFDSRVAHHFSIDISAIIANWQTGPLWDSILFSDFRLALAD